MRLQQADILFIYINTMISINLKTLIYSFFVTFIKCSESPSPSVLILGAGASGIAAASNLLEHNITNVKILEISNRIGGRIHSVEFGDGIVDLGAEWCYGEVNNTVYDLVKDLDLLKSEDIRMNFFYSTNEILDPLVTAELWEVFEEIYFSEEEGNNTLDEYFTKRYRERVTVLYKNDENKLQIALDAYDLFLTLILANEGAFSASDISSQKDFIAEGDLQLGWKNTGYKIILDVLMKKYPNAENALPVMEKIEFSKEVVRITWNGDGNFSKPTVKCLDGSEYTADHVIVTFSLGVLKNYQQSLFVPPLPSEKVRAIEELGFGAVGKIFLHFPNLWWSANNYTNFNFVWSNKDKQDIHNAATFEDSKVWLLNMFGLLGHKENPHVLTAWFAGSSVPEIELFTDEKVINGIMFVARKFLGSLYNNITLPDAIIRHKWYSDPYFKGTYSYQTPNSRTRNISGETVLLQPLESRNGKQTLLFAGEATHPHFYATVQGAIDSGRREADRIIKLYSS